MIAKIYSWVLASAWVAWGVFMLLYLVPRLQELFAGFGLAAPFVLRVTFIAGPFGCFLIAATVATGIALNAHRFHARFVNLVLTIALLAWVACLIDIPFRHITFSI